MSLRDLLYPVTDPPACSWAFTRKLGCRRGVRCYSVRLWRCERVLAPAAFDCSWFLLLCFVVVIRTCNDNRVDYNTAVHSWDRLSYLSRVSCPCSGRRTLSDSLREEGGIALRSNLYVFRRIRRYILRLNIARSPAVNPSLDKNVCDGTCSVKATAECVIQGNLW